MKITSVSHPFVKHLVKLRKDRVYRHQQQRVLLEGIKPVGEVCIAYSLVVVQGMVPPKGCRFQKIYEVSPAIFKKISSMENPEGILAEVAIPPQADLRKKRRLIALDGIADPGNMGTLLRTALALGWEGAFILQGCVDPFNDKAVRAARGAIFRLPLFQGSWEELEDLVKQGGFSPIVADIRGKSPDPYRNSSDPLLLVLGNEAHGPREEARQKWEKIALPLTPLVDSLNVAVAGGILMYLLQN